MSVNKVILVGNVGKDPETRYLDEGTAISKFPLATSETYRNRDGERVSNTEWHNVVLWRGMAQVAEKYIKKGTQVYIEGRIKTRSYDDANGIKKYITEIVGDQMQLLGRRPDDSGTPGDSGTGTRGDSGTVNQGETKSGNQGDSGTGNQGDSGSQAAQKTSGPSREASPESTDPFDSGDNGPDDLPF